MLAIFVILILLFSIFFIWKGSDWITDSMVPVATKLGTGYIAVTTILVSALISLPEIFIAVYSYLLGHLEAGLGVIIGSVIANIGLCVGLSAIIKPLWVNKTVAIRDGAFLIVVVIIVLLFGADLQYTRTEGWVLLLLFIPYALNVWISEQGKTKETQKRKVKELENNLKLFGQMDFLEFKPSVLTFFIGAGMIMVGSYFFSFSLVEITGMLPIPEMITGIIIGGIGTALPNIAAAIEGTRKGYRDAAITETFGSNIFTLLVTLGIIVILKPFTIAGKLFYFDMVWMIVIHLLMIGFIFKGYGYKEDSLTRFEGVALMIFFLAIIIIDLIVFA